MSLKAEFGKAVRNIREKTGKSQYELARMVDVSLRHIYNIEHGRTDPQLSTVCRLAVCLDIDLNAFKQYVTSDDGIFWKDGATLEDVL
ncbi:MAG: helix-turn-helix domain-containing protein [Candidatus Fimenecus sp.]